MLKWN